MSQPLLELKRLLASQISASGRVISMGNGMVRVATSGGVVEAAANGSLVVGDRVVVKGGMASKTQISGSDTQVFFV